MSCPFYAQALHRSPGGQWVLIPNPGSNQCALITNAHSPCIMELAARIPEWYLCPRNPRPEDDSDGH